MRKARNKKWASSVLASLLLVQTVFTTAPALAVSPDSVHIHSTLSKSLDDGDKDDVSDDEQDQSDKEQEDVNGTESEEPEKEPEEDTGESEDENESDEGTGESEDEKDPEEDVDEPDEEIELPEDYEDLFALVKDGYDTFKENKDVKSGIHFSYLLANLPVNNDTLDQSDKADFLREYVEYSKQLEVEVRESINFAIVQDLYNYAKENESQDDALLAKDHLVLLKEDTEGKELVKKVEQLVEDLKINLDEDDIIGEDNNIGDDTEIEYNPEYENGNKEETVRPPNTNQKPPNIPDYDFTNSTSRHYYSGGVCMVETSYYKNGKLIRKQNRLASKAEAGLCLRSVSSREFTKAERDKAATITGYNPYDPAQRRARYKELRKDRLSQSDSEESLNSVTIQYTFDKYDDSPYYNDTGIGIGEKKLVSYNQAKSALQIISIQAQGKFVEDKSQVLALIDGRIIRIHEYEGEVEFEQFQKEFELSPIGVIAQDTRTGTQQEIADLVEIKGISNLSVDGNMIPLDVSLIVDQNITLFPAKQIAEILGGEVIIDGEDIVIKFKDKRFTYKENTQLVKINDVEKDIGVPVRLNNEGVAMIPIQELLVETGKVLYVENEELHLENADDQ